VAETADEWLEGGIGVPGDSGAPVIDSDNNSLYGFLWGRNKYWGDGPRTVYFTSMADVSDDILEKYPQLREPLRLPQSCSREREIEAELFCPECRSEVEDVGSSDGISVMSLGEIISGEDYAGLERSTTTQSDTNSSMSFETDNPIVSYSPIDREGFDNLSDLLPSTADVDIALATALDPFQYYGNLDHNTGINDENLSLDCENSDSDEVEFTARSCARKRNPQRRFAHGKTPDSWVKLETKSNRCLNVATKATPTGKKPAPSLLDSFLMTTGVRGKSTLETMYDWILTSNVCSS